jgi:hypothetical protein
VAVPANMTSAPPSGGVSAPGADTTPPPSPSGLHEPPPIPSPPSPPIPPLLYDLNDLSDAVADGTVFSLVRRTDRSGREGAVESTWLKLGVRLS